MPAQAGVYFDARVKAQKSHGFSRSVLDHFVESRRELGSTAQNWNDGGNAFHRDRKILPQLNSVMCSLLSFAPAKRTVKDRG